LGGGNAGGLRFPSRAEVVFVVVDVVVALLLVPRCRNPNGVPVSELWLWFGVVVVDSFVNTVKAWFEKDDGVEVEVVPDVRGRWRLWMLSNRGVVW